MDSRKGGVSMNNEAISQEIMDEIKALSQGQVMDPRVTDLKLKYMIVQLLNDIKIQLYEISHYGIGTD